MIQLGVQAVDLTARGFALGVIELMSETAVGARDDGQGHLQIPE